MLGLLNFSWKVDSALGSSEKLENVGRAVPNYCDG